MKKAQPKTTGELDLQADKKVVSRSKSCTRILEISVTPPGEKAGKNRPPLNISLVLDRSGSMAGEKLHFVKQAAAHVIDLLDEKDRASVVIYDDQVETIVPPGNLSDKFKKKANASIQTIESGNSTFLSGGWLRGCELVAEGSGSSSINRVLLLTDGQANVGMTSSDELASHSREIFRRGVSTSCFGAGLGYDEHLLEAMANSGGGNFHFLETVNAIPIVFEREFKELVDIALRDVRVSLQLPEGVKGSVLAGWPTETKKGNLTISVGSLNAGRTQRIYLRLAFEKGILSKELSIPVKVHGKDEGNLDNEAAETILFKVVTASEEKAAVENKSLLERFAEVEMAEKANEALKRERAGDRAGSSRLMQSSLNANRANMPAGMRSKYEHMVNDLSGGMNEQSRKVYHLEQYESKRGRAAVRDYQLKMVNGHLITQIEGKSVLIDTGVPISIGRISNFHFLNEVHPLSQDYLGVTLEYLEKMVGTSIDILMGSDILKKYYLTIDLHGNRITFSAQPPFMSANQVPMTDFMGTPIVSFTVDGVDRLMFVDTGAKLSYVNKKIAAKYSSIGNETDFYPGMGEFETPIYEVPFQFGKMGFQLCCGVLPTMLEKTLLVTGNSGIIGTELYQKFLVCLAFPEKAIFLDQVRS
jgi:Ca-activated chloride channel family protein